MFYAHLVQFLIVLAKIKIHSEFRISQKTPNTLNVLSSQKDAKNTPTIGNNKTKNWIKT